MEAYLLWYMFGGLLLILEAFSPGLFIFICFALAACFTGLSQQLAFMASSPLSLAAQLGIFLVAALLALFFIKPLLKLIIRMPDASKSLYTQRLIATEAMVFKTIRPQEMGAVRLMDSDETWLAKASEEIPEATRVRIVAVEANHLVVERMLPQNPA